MSSEATVVAGTCSSVYSISFAILMISHVTGRQSESIPKKIQYLGVYVSKERQRMKMLLLTMR